MSANCQSVQEELELYLLEELEPERAREVRAHLTSCSSCQKALANARMLLEKVDHLLRHPTPPPELVERILLRTRRRERLRRLRLPLAVAASFLVGFLAFLVLRPSQPSGPTVVEVQGGRIEASAGARFEVLTPCLVRLDRGELLVDVQPGEEEFVVETPAARAVALGTKFYVRTQARKEEEMKGLRFVTTVVVLSGVVQLSNPYGAETGYRGAILYAEENTSPKKQGVEANTAFALELYAQLRKEEGNLFFSPYSISTALAMTYAGARGDTAAQMARVLHFEKLEPEVLHRAFGQLIDELNKRGEKGGYKLSVANALWGQKGYGFLKSFLDLVKTSYGGGFNEVDFEGATEAARQTINARVEKETKGKIRDLIKPEILDPLTRLVLTNAIYFKGDWALKFKEERTKPAPFKLLDGKSVEVPMMRQAEEFGYMDGDDFQMLELSYKGEELSMVVLLPREVDGLTRLEKSLTQANLQEWLSKLTKQEVHVFLPRFKITRAFRLDEILKAMGMTDAFSLADFSGMTGRKDLFVTAVIHKAFVEVNEEGTEAAAATAVPAAAKALEPKPTFRADHPFLFLIRDMRSGSILFLGRVMNPLK